MTYSELKTETSALLQIRGEARMSDDDALLLPLLKRAFFYVMDRTTPMVLVESDPAFKMYRQLDATHFLRFPLFPSGVDADTQELDMDFELCSVLAALLASFMAREAVSIDFFRSEVNNSISAFNFKLYESDVIYAKL